MQKPATQIILKPSPKSVLTTVKSNEPESKPTPTAEIHSKATSPTLVEFQTNNAQIPEWRLQLKNAVRQRLNQDNDRPEGTQTKPTISATPAKSYPTSGGNALKSEIIENPIPANVQNEQLANALRRIELSRQKYFITEPEDPVEIPVEEKPAKDYPFTIASRNDNPTPPTQEELKSSVNFPPKPKLVPKNKISKGKDLYDTSELDPEFIPAKISSSFEKRPIQTETENPVTNNTKKIELDIEKETDYIYAEVNKVHIKAIEEKNDEKEIVTEDFAPFALRFNAGLFDLIVGSFASLVLLSPFMLLGGNWFTVAGFFAFLATCSIVLFIYLTTTIGVFGKTFGMHLFSLEIVDYYDDEYPTFHQAAVSSSIYLLSLAFFGLGFVTSLFDQDKRAVHDLVSGTLIVKEI